MLAGALFGNLQVSHEVVTDSKYAIDLLNGRAFPNENRLMVRFLQRLYRRVRKLFRVGITKVEGHTGWEVN